MPVTAREPWVKIKLGLRRSDKLAALPSDTARLGWHYVLLEAKVQRRLGVFVSRAHFVDVMGRFGRYLPEYLARGLAHESPELCERCLQTYPDVTKGEIVVHDYRREQRDPTNADRQQEWRERNEPRNAERNGSDNGEITPEVTPTVTMHSRARGTTVTVTERELEKVPSPLSDARDGEPSKKNGKTTMPSVASVLARSPETFHDAESKREHDAWSSFGSEWSAVRLALRSKGLRLPPAGEVDEPGSQRALLFDLLDAWPDSVVRWIRESRGRTMRDVVADVLEAYHKARDEAADDADARESNWQDAKARESIEARGRVTQLAEGRGEALDDYGF